MVVTTRGQQEQARYENMMLGGSIGPPLDLHQDTDTHTHTDSHFLAYIEGMQPSKAHHRTHFLWQVSQTLSPNRKPQIGLPEAPMTSLRPSGLLPVIHLELFLSGSAQDVC